MILLTSNPLVFFICLPNSSSAPQILPPRSSVRSCAPLKFLRSRKNSDLITVQCLFPSKYIQNERHSRCLVQIQIFRYRRRRSKCAHLRVISVIPGADSKICSTGLLGNVGFKEQLLASNDADILYQVLYGRHKQFARTSSSGWQILHLYAART